MKRSISILISLMMALTLIPYTAFAETGSTGEETEGVETITMEMVIDEPEEVALELLVNTKVTVESDELGAAYGILTGSSLIISDGIALYRSTIKITPTRIGTAKLTIKSNGTAVRVYNIEVRAAEKTAETFIDKYDVFEYISHFDEEITGTNTEKVTVSVISKTQRNTTSMINGVPVTEVLYVYEIQAEYSEVGTATFSLVGSKSGEFCKITAEVIDPQDHRHIETALPGSAATCTEDGLTEGISCETCGEVLSAQKVIPAAGHKYEWIVDREPTEDEDGEKHEDCKVCHAVRNENTVIDKLTHSHNMVRTVAREATCETDGNIEFFSCTVCENSFTDVNGEHAVKAEDTVIVSSGHNYSAWQIMNGATCYRKGYQFASCQNCGRPEIEEIPLKPHILRASRIAPTCTKDGADTIACENCRHEVSDVIPATGHEVQNVKAVEATCVMDGMTEGTVCSKCSEYVDAPEIIPAAGHAYGAWIVDKASTCDVMGSKHRICDVCGEEEYAEIEKLQHTVVIIPAVAPTCRRNGLTAGIRCEVCDNVVKSQEPIAKLEHKWDSKYTVDKKASIRNGGSMSYHCLICNLKDSDSVTKIYMIKKTTVKSVAYNGSVLYPAVTVIDNSGKRLKKGTDFTVTVKNNAGIRVKPKNVGTYKAVVSFKEKYSGSVVKTFMINPEATEIAKLLKGRRQFTVKWDKRTEQVTGYQIRYSSNSNMNKAKYALVKNNKTVSRTFKSLSAQKKYWVQVRTYKTVNGNKYYSSWSSKKYVTTK